MRELVDADSASLSKASTGGDCCCFVVLLLVFLTFSVLVANPKILLYTVVSPLRDLLNREKITL